MARAAKFNPLKHETAGQKKRRLQHASRHHQSRTVFNSLLQGDYRPPILENQPQHSHSDGLETEDDEQPHHFDINNPPEDNPVRPVESSEIHSNWGSIPWNIPSPAIPPKRPLFSALNPETTAAIRQHDRRVVHLTQADNWKKAMSTLFSSYVWLKEKTDNWTAKCTFDSFAKRFCKCDDTAREAVAWVDLVDITGQQRVKFHFCPCMPRSVQILANGFFPSSPSTPSAGFSMRLLAYHNYAWHYSNVRMLPFTETQRVFSEERSEILWNRSKTSGRDLRQCFSSAVLVYRELLKMNSELIRSCLRLNETQKLASEVCPACFGPTKKTGSHRIPSVSNRLIVALDGNFQHRHQKLAGRNHIPLVTPEIFVQPSDLDDMKTYISNQERLNKVRKKADRCADSHKAADDTRNETTWKSCDDTGLMGSCCRHDSVIYLANIHGTGENRALPLTILKRILGNIEQDRPRDIFPDSRNRLNLGTSVFHAYVHEWGCQVKYNPRYQPGWGLSDGESLERLWSSLSPQVSPLRYATRNNRLAALAHRCKYRNQQSISKLAAWLRRKFDQALLRRDTEMIVINELLQIHNPHSDGNERYTVGFFWSQWSDQVRVALENKENEDESKEKLAQFLRNENILQSYRNCILSGRLPESWIEVDEMITVILDKEKAQQELAASLGKDYEDLRGTCQSELSLLTQLWKAKSDLYAQAVEVRAEQQPLENAQSGNTVGTRMKERIFAAIKRRKGPVVKAINNFNMRRKEYLQKTDPRRLLLPENQDLTFDSFLTIDLDDPLWIDDHFYYARAPWALDPQVRRGIKSVLFLDRVEEEIELLTQELDRSITWAYEYWKSLLDTISELELESEEPIDLANRFASILTNFQMKGKLRLLRSELKRHLRDHERLMVAWMVDVEVLWKNTRSQHTKADHPWFDVISSIKEALTRSDIGTIEDTLEALSFVDGEPEAEQPEDEAWEADHDDQTTPDQTTPEGEEAGEGTDEVTQ
ncbi:hypothetical protein PGTUg99_006968 [Puccinia graminis f. sp. tritici]|uniref:CxC1-like cysteine cluster associated with KDZ transposases domain-containing protein n=1 Tax=Puccinia graminis f. sp. tritici TaxID=56615 RepID=A0A5B0RK68_PUCGR|nr:hypothetical protein PGTUg99_006968 [Puccinia graminis f. sp. tritici]